MNQRTRRVIGFVLLYLCVMLGGRTAVCAEPAKVKLKNGSTFSATILQQRGDHLVLGIQRSDVATVNGEPLPPPVAVGAPAAHFSVIDLNGVTHTLPQAHPTPTLLVFWATWCPHCRADVPLLADLFTRYQEQGLRLLAVSVDREFESVRAFVQQHALPYPIVVAGRQPTTAGVDMPQRYEASGVPMYVLIDARGTIVRIFAGSVTEMHIDVESDIKQVLADAKTTPTKDAFKPTSSRKKR